MNRLELFFARLLAGAVVGFLWAFIALPVCWLAGLPATFGQAWAMSFFAAYLVIINKGLKPA